MALVSFQVPTLVGPVELCRRPALLALKLELRGQLLLLLLSLLNGAFCVSVLMSRALPWCAMACQVRLREIVRVICTSLSQIGKDSCVLTIMEPSTVRLMPPIADLFYPPGNLKSSESFLEEFSSLKDSYCKGLTVAWRDCQAPQTSGVSSGSTCCC